MRSLLLIGLLVFSIICSADIYLQTDKNGNQIYSDTPTEGAKKLNLPGASAITTNKNAETTTATTLATPATNTTGTTPANGAYTQFLIDSPLDQQTYNNNPRDIPVVLLVNPDLQKGDKTQLYLDGKAVGAPAETTHLLLNNIDRGTHQLYAVIIDPNNNIIKQSQTITINLHYVHLGTPGG